jgi:hypothetical protein
MCPQNRRECAFQLRKALTGTARRFKHRLQHGLASSKHSEALYRELVEAATVATGVPLTRTQQLMFTVGNRARVRACVCRSLHPFRAPPWIGCGNASDSSCLLGSLDCLRTRQGVLPCTGQQAAAL